MISCTEAALADDHADGDQRDGGHRRQPDAGDDAGQRQRQLHPHQPAEPAVAHARRAASSTSCGTCSRPDRVLRMISSRA